MSEFDLTGNAILSSTDKNPKTLSITRKDTNSETAGVTTFAEIQMSIAGADDQGILLFRTKSSGSSFPEDRLSIDVAGNVGIGTPSPGQKLDVQGGYVIISDVVGNDRTTKAFIEGVKDVSYFGSLGSQRASFGNSENWETLTVKGGKVGIGMTEPNAKLHLYNGNAHFEGTSTGSPIVNSNVYGLQIGPLHNRNTTMGSYYPGIAFNHLLNYNGGTSYNVAPQAWIGLKLYDTPGSERSYLVFATKEGTGTSGTGTDIPSPRMVIDPFGNVGIGTQGHSARVEVSGDATNPIFIVNTQGSTSNPRTFTLRNNEQGIIGFGAYPGAWTSALAIQNNNNTRQLWISPLDSATNENARIRAAGTGLDFYVGGTTTDTGTQALSLNSNGNVGIGGSPEAKLTIVSDNFGGLDRANQFVIKGSTNQNLRLNLGIHTEASKPYADIGFVEEGVEWRDLVLAKNGGNVGIGTSDLNDNKLTVYNPGGGTPVSGMSVDVYTFGTIENARKSYFFRVRDIGAGPSSPFYIRGDGNVYITGQAYKPGGGYWGNSSSDMGYKKNVEHLKGALDLLLKLRGVNFEYKEPEKHGYLNGKQMGLIAQEVEDVFPEWVGENSDGYKNLTIRGFEALAIEAFRDIHSINEELKKEIKELKNMFKSLKKNRK